MVDGLSVATDVMWSNSPTTLSAAWAGFFDLEYNVSLTYEAGIGPCDEWQTLPLQLMGDAETVEFSVASDAACALRPVDSSGVPAAGACTLEHNQTYCAVVRAANPHGLFSARRRSNGVRVCLRNPSEGVVTTGGDLSTLSTRVSWRNFRDGCVLVQGLETLPASQAASTLCH